MTPALEQIKALPAPAMRACVVKRNGYEDIIAELTGDGPAVFRDDGLYTEEQVRELLAKERAALQAPRDEAGEAERRVAVLENLRLRIEMGGDISSVLKRPERMEALDAAIRALRQGGGWTRTKPTEQGIYRVRGWHIGSEADVAVVSVIEYDDTLVCNLHERNSDTEYEEWDDLARFSDRFEWQRVADLYAAPPSPAKEG